MKIDELDTKILSHIHESGQRLSVNRIVELCDSNISTVKRRLDKLAPLFINFETTINFEDLDYYAFIFLLNYPNNDRSIRFEPNEYRELKYYVYLRVIHTEDQIILHTFFKDLETFIDFNEYLKEAGFNPKFSKIESNESFSNFSLLKTEETKK